MNYNNLIWVIDDSPTVRKILEVFLHREGYQVLTFKNGKEALQHRGHVPAVILIDLVMPYVDGYTVLRHFKARRWYNDSSYQPSYIIISRCDGVIDRLKCRLAGALYVINKPFKTQDVLKVIQAYS